MGIRDSIYSYIGNGINGLFSNRVRLDIANKTIQESGSSNSLKAQKYYNILQPVSLAVNKISQDASRILIELQDNNGVTINDNDILNKYYYFLENKYGQNGISFSYQDLVMQIVSNLKLNNEYFLRIFYHNIKDVVLGIELVPSSLCIEKINSIDGYIDGFEVLFSANNRNSSQIFTRIKGMEHIKKTSIYKYYPEKKVAQGNNIDTYLIHYHVTNGIEIVEMDNSYQKYDFLPQLRGISNINLIKQSLELYHNLENAILDLTTIDQVQRNTLYINSTDQKNVEENFKMDGHPRLVTNSGKNVDKNIEWISKGIDAQKDLIHYYNMRTQESQSISQYFGIPTRIVSTAGSAYNNLAVATDEYERNLLGIMSNITHFLTNVLSIISQNFMANNYKVVIKKNSSFLIKKEIKADLEIEKEFSSVNEIREQYFDKPPIVGGDLIISKGIKSTELAPDKAIKQKRKMPHTGERIIKKKT